MITKITHMTLFVHDQNEAFQALGVITLKPPQQHPWGIAAAYLDLYENVIYICQPNE